MYWPLGAPRIYSAKIPGHVGFYDSDNDDGSSIVAVSPVDDPAAESQAFETQGILAKQVEQDDDDAAIVGAKEDFFKGNEGENEAHASRRLGDAAKSGSSLDVTFTDAIGEIKNSSNSDLLALKVSRNGALFATITASELTIWQTRPTAVVAHVRRSTLSLTNYGPNVDLMIRPDNQIFVVQTNLGYLITYSLATDYNARVYKPTFVQSHYSHSRQSSSMSAGGVMRGIGQRAGGFMTGPGEAGGVKEYSVRFRMVIKVDAGIVKALALDDELIVATEKPAAVQCIRWTPDAKGSQTTTELLGRMNWMQKRVTIVDMVHDRPMNISTWVTSDGRAYAVQKLSPLELAETPSKLFKGYCFHVPSKPDEYAIKAAINARFSLVAVACTNGHLFVYNARDYVGNIPLSHILQPPSTSTGKVTTVTWSPDGYAVFVGYEKGWAMWSVYGKPGAHSFLSDREICKRAVGEGYLEGIRDGGWVGGGQDILLIKWKGDERIWAIEMAKNAITGCYNSANVARAILHTNERLLLYRGYDLTDLTTLSQENSVLWNHIAIPPAYLVDNWPLKAVTISPDGRYVAVAGRRGLAHYSVNSGRWKTFTNPQMEGFQVRGGMCWYHHILIAAVESDDVYELRLYSRETELDNSLVLHIETVPSPIILISLVGFDSLLVYTLDNVLYHYVITPAKESVKLIEVGRLTFHGIIRSPTRVRGVSWVLPEDQIREGDPSRDVTVASVLFLVDGKLALLQPSSDDGGDVKYEMKVLEKNVEYYSLMREQPVQFAIDKPQYEPIQTPSQMVSAGHGEFGEGLKDSLWVFDGTDLKAWIDVQEVLHAVRRESGGLPPAVQVRLDFYPMSILLGKGIILGIEPELIQRRDINFAYFKFFTRTHLFIHNFFRHYLTYGQPKEALELAAHFEKLAYFPHALEVLLHDVLDDEADDPPDPEEAVLPEVIRFLSNFPSYLDIIVQCTRKTEVASWRHLFDVVGSPQALFEESLSKGNLKTAGGYLLILHTLEKLSSSSKDMVRLLSIAVSQGDWDLCKELARFLMAVDDSGRTLKEALELVELRSPVEEIDRSFMFESARLMPPPVGRKDVGLGIEKSRLSSGIGSGGSSTTDGEDKTEDGDDNDGSLVEIGNLHLSKSPGER